MQKLRFAAPVILACVVATAGASASNGQVLEVDSNALSTYWTPAKGSFSPGLLKPARGPMASEVQVEYTIDDNGRVRDVEVLHAKPEGASTDWAIGAIKASRFVAAEGNTAHIAVRTSTIVTLTPKDGP